MQQLSWTEEGLVGSWLTEVSMTRVPTPVLRVPCVSLPLSQIPPTYQIFVRPLIGHEETFNVSPTDTVLDLKVQILHRLGYQLNDQKLLFGPGILENDKTLADSGVSREKCVRVNIRVRGGKPVILLYPPTQLKAAVRLRLSPLDVYCVIPQAPLPHGTTIMGLSGKMSSVPTTLVRMSFV